MWAPEFLSLLAMTVFFLCGVFALFGQELRQRRQIQALQQQLDAFLEASISVAQTVERLSGSALEPARPNQAVATRRWLLGEAQQRLNQGATVGDVGNTLGLSRDEVQLLRLQHR